MVPESGIARARDPVHRPGSPLPPAKPSPVSIASRVTPQGPCGSAAPSRRRGLMDPSVPLDRRRAVARPWVAVPTTWGVAATLLTANPAAATKLVRQSLDHLSANNDLIVH